MSIHRLLWINCISIVVRVSFELGRGVWASFSVLPAYSCGLVGVIFGPTLDVGGREFLFLCGCRVDSRLVTFGDCRVKLRC